MIKLHDVTKTFDNDLAVDHLHLTVKKGAIYGLLGSNGAGKTTLLKMIAGIYRPDAGTIHVSDEPIYENNAIKQKIVFIPDSLYFFPQSTAAQMAAYYRSMYPNWNEERYQQLQKVFNIAPTQKLHKLSKGMKRQVAFWLALSCMPDLLILDEPIDGLDPVMRKTIKNLLFQEVAERELTVIISSHNLREIEDICDHVGIMHHGRLLIERDLDDLKADIHKIQFALAHTEAEKLLLEKLEVLYEEKRGSVRLWIVRGQADSIEQIFEQADPLIFDILPLTLEEIFIYEMGDAGYEIGKVLL